MGEINISSFIASLDHDVRNQLYSSPWTCQALFRALTPLAQQYVLRLLYVQQPVADGLVASWAKAEFKSQHQAAIQQLALLGLLRHGAAAHGKALQLLDAFKQQLRKALASGGMSSQHVDDMVYHDQPPAEDTAAYSHRQWESLLEFLLNPSASPPAMPPELRKLLPRPEDQLNLQQLCEKAGLRTPRDQGAALTPSGLKFLLLDSYSQLWSFLRKYLSVASQHSGSELASALSFLLQLGFMRVGQPYSFSALSPLERRIAAHMAQLGLLNTFVAQVDKQPYFCPTPLAASLCGGQAGVAGASEAAAGYLMVQTNYKIYALSRSDIHAKIMEQFCLVDCRLPDNIVCTLTRESVQAALTRGLDSNDIITFLQKHAHPIVAKRVPVVPEVVQDQIRLWQAELNRAETRSGYHYQNFETVKVYESSRDFARQKGYLLWYDDKAYQLVVKSEGHEQMKEHIKVLKAQLGIR